jgi:cytochrome c oxidase subunit III
MNSRSTLDVSHLPDVAFGTRHPLWWGTMGLALIEATMFGLLIASYFYLRLGFSVWPPPGIRPQGALWPTANVLIMLASCWPTYQASEAAKHDDKRGVQVWLSLNLAIGAITVILRAWLWNDMNFSWRTNVYGSMIWMIMELHTLDYVISLLVTAVVLAIAFTPRFGRKQRVASEADGFGWYFIVAVWIPLYAIVYLGPYLVPGK